MEASPAQVEFLPAHKSWIGDKPPQGGEAYYITIDIKWEEDEAAEARRLQATIAAAATMVHESFVIHLLGDGLDEEETKHLPTTPLRWLRWFFRLLPQLVASSTTFLLRPKPRPFVVGEPVDFMEFCRIEEERIRAMMPGHFEQLAMDRQLMKDCLSHYNSRHPGDEYEPAPGEVTRHCSFRTHIFWTHGNFLARKRSGFSVLPAPRTMFFFELANADGSDEVVTCIPLDEPVTEAFSVLGFPLGPSTRRSGTWECFCKTCSSRVDARYPDLKRTLPCGHEEVESVCKMCYSSSIVLHPAPGDFAFGYHDPY